MEGLRCRCTIGDRDRLSNRIGRAPGSGVRERRKYPGGVRLRARNLGDIERLLLYRRGGSGLNEIDISRPRRSAGLRERLRLPAFDAGFGVTSRPNGSFTTFGRFLAITVRTS